MTRLSLVFFLLLISTSTPAFAATYVVSPDGSGDFPTIQAAIDAAVDGGIIELTDGTFTGDGNRDIDYAGKSITVR
jgi:pectin methylesterase-like acyl-CoA thioesterase